MNYIFKKIKSNSKFYKSHSDSIDNYTFMWQLLLEKQDYANEVYRFISKCIYNKYELNLAEKNCSIFLFGILAGGATKQELKNVFGSAHRFNNLINTYWNYYGTVGNTTFRVATSKRGTVVEVPANISIDDCKKMVKFFIDTFEIPDRIKESIRKIGEK